jgi:hypothetical protein
MEAVYSVETSADFELTTRRYIPEESKLNNHRCENLMSCINGTSPLIFLQGFSLLDDITVSSANTSASNTRKIIMTGGKIMIWGNLGVF